jgi:hypothetical protein
VGFFGCFPYFETDFNTNSLLLYQLHIKCDKTTTHSFTKPAMKTKRNVLYTWNKMACVTNGQVARSHKQHLMCDLCTAAPSPHFENLLNTPRMWIVNPIELR